MADDVQMIQDIATIKAYMELLPEIRADVKRINGNMRDMQVWREQHEQEHRQDDEHFNTWLKVVFPLAVTGILMLIGLAISHADELRRILP